MRTSNEWLIKRQWFYYEILYTHAHNTLAPRDWQSAALIVYRLGNVEISIVAAIVI